MYNNYFYEMAGCLNSAGNAYLYSRLLLSSKNHKCVPVFTNTHKVIKPLSKFYIFLKVLFLNAANCKGKKAYFFVLLYLSEIVYYS